MSLEINIDKEVGEVGAFVAYMVCMVGFLISCAVFILCLLDLLRSIVEVPEMHQHRYIRIRNRRIVRRSRRTEYKDRILRMRIALFKRRAKAQFECIAEFASAREERRREIEGYATRMVQFQAEEAQAQARLAEAKKVCQATAQEKAETIAVLRESVRITSEANQVKNDIKVTLRRIRADEVAMEEQEVLAVIQTRQQETEAVDGKIDQDRRVLFQMIEARRVIDELILQANRRR